MFWIDLVGTLASSIGLGVSVWVLVVARGAKRAAEEARAVARRKNFMEELGVAEHKLQELGVFIQQEEWIGVQIRTTEILAICRSAMSRWSDHLSEGRVNGVLTAAELVHSIATKSAQVSMAEQLSPTDKKRLVDTHLKASGLLSDALGEVRRHDERDGGNDANTEGPGLRRLLDK
jgi:hypothetical protein